MLTLPNLGLAIPKTGLLLLTVVSLLSWYLLFVAKVQLGGDIAEYYGITESIIHHQSLELRPTDRVELEKKLHAAYFDDPGYYLVGRNGQRFPVHFFSYSLLAVPLRLILEAIRAESLKALWLTNVMGWTVGILLAWRWLQSEWSRFLSILLSLTSPLLFFFTWPGPDLWYLSLLFAGSVAFLHNSLAVAGIITAVASWHSQPLVILTALIMATYLYQRIQFSPKKDKRCLVLPIDAIATAVAVGFIAGIPLLYNLYAFGTTTPWILLQDGWTLINGFGIHNINLLKLFEQWFDVNIGVFWYAPLYVLTAIVLALKKPKNKLPAFLLGFSLLTALFYQTNPGWHYGAAGYGPSRHAVFLVPILLAVIMSRLRPSKTNLLVVLTIVATQLPILAHNNFVEPNLTNTLKHNALARLLLTYQPQLYAPTPEIFVDRTNQADQTYPTSAVYKVKGECRKAYILTTDVEQVEAECGPLDVGSKGTLENEFLHAASYSRKLTTNEATFWPMAASCGLHQEKTASPFVCMRTIEQVMLHTGTTQPERFKKLPELDAPGVWKLVKGKPITITVPPGYIVHHNSIIGSYVTF